MTNRIIMNRNIELTTRAFIPATNPDIYQTERDSIYKYTKKSINLRKMALILIDVWENHPNNGWLERANKHRKRTIKPLLDLTRKHNIAIVHVPHSSLPLYKIASDCTPIEGELVIDSEPSEDKLITFLKEKNIKTLLYAGYSSNKCVICRPTGIINMHNLGYDIILIRDCTLAIETPETLDGEWCNKVSINTVESLWGTTTTLEDLKLALKMEENP